MKSNFWCWHWKFRAVTLANLVSSKGARLARHGLWTLQLSPYSSSDSYRLNPVEGIIEIIRNRYGYIYMYFGREKLGFVPRTQNAEMGCSGPSKWAKAPKFGNELFCGGHATHISFFAKNKHTNTYGVPGHKTIHFQFRGLLPILGARILGHGGQSPTFLYQNTHIYLSISVSTYFYDAFYRVKAAGAGR
jgi:hypothetical protein